MILGLRGRPERLYQFYENLNYIFPDAAALPVTESEVVERSGIHYITAFVNMKGEVDLGYFIHHRPHMSVVYLEEIQEHRNLFLTKLNKQIEKYGTEQKTEDLEKVS